MSPSLVASILERLESHDHRITAPRMAFWSPEGEWDVENRGVAPDVEVDFDPQAVRAGHDPQLEKAVQIVLEELKKHPETHSLGISVEEEVNSLERKLEV